MARTAIGCATETQQRWVVDGDRRHNGDLTVMDGNERRNRDVKAMDGLTAMDSNSMVMDGAEGHQLTVHWLLDGDGWCGGSSTAIEQGTARLQWRW